MKIVKIKGVLILDKLTDSYVLHGDNEKTPAQMFKLLTDGQTPLWNFDPSGDATHMVEFEVTVPELESETTTTKPYYSNDPECIPGN